MSKQRFFFFKQEYKNNNNAMRNVLIVFVKAFNCFMQNNAITINRIEK